MMILRLPCCSSEDLQSLPAGICGSRLVAFESINETCELWMLRMKIAGKNLRRIHGG
uniref:Uncharacterized protein n=1 Tax=Helianthus annuus TaxID=4232 RepID=A0A251V2F7_HELAN